jgi:hypothetical protein
MLCSDVSSMTPAIGQYMTVVNTPVVHDACHETIVATHLWLAVSRHFCLATCCCVYAVGSNAYMQRVGSLTSTRHDSSQCNRKTQAALI